MHNSIRFRNHISIVIERTWRSLLFLIFLLISGFARPLAELAGSASRITQDSRIPVLLSILGVLILLLLFVGWQILIWSKTYISVCDQTLIIERNTLNRRKHTIGIANISNVNTEQNLFEMLMGTCKLKLDTNSLSTANKTDVMIVLKKEQAESFRLYLLSLLEGDRKEADALPQNVPATSEDNAIHASVGDIIRHGLFSINLFSVLVLAGCIVGAAAGAEEILREGFSQQSILSVLISMILLISMFASAFWDIAKGFIRYYDFRVWRSDDKLYIHYGLLKKVAYTIPVDKINALKLSQTLAARLTGRYMAEIINVGMGDDDSEKNSFLLLYDRQDRIRETLHLLLPEYAQDLKMEFPKQPRTVWAAWLCPLSLYLAVAAVSAHVAWLWLAKYHILILAVLAAAVLLAPITLLLRYHTAGMDVGSDFLLISRGYCRRSILMTAFSRIQYVELEQNPLAKAARIQKGQIHLLASALNQVHGIPYFPAQDSTRIRERLLHSKEKPEYTGTSK